MQASDPGKLQSSINVTPLVDVVLVLLIIFMVIVPQLQAGPDLELPTTDRPPKSKEEERQIVVAIQRDGAIWVDSAVMTAELFPDRMRAAADRNAGARVVIKGDARLSFGEVRQAMLAVEAAGFKNVGLIAERRGEGGGGD